MITNASVDWVTMTSAEDKVGMEWYSMYCKYRTKMQKEGDAEKHFNNGFYGGLGIARMKWGHSDDLGYLIIISGPDAELYWSHLKPNGARVTRLDLCVDFIPQDLIYLAKELYEKAGEKRRKEPPKLSLYLGPDGGDTLYVGSRHSQQFGRLYDKGVESGQAAPGRKWRAEVEYKKPLAGLMAEELALETGGTRIQAITDTVINWFSDRDIKIPENLPGGDPIKVSVEQRITTADRKLAWLRTQVQPSVKTLVSLGLGKEVLKSLLIDEETLLRIFAGEN